VSGTNSGTNFDEEELLVQKRKSFDGELDITPMIDVVFLLLIFFMVTSTMQQDSGIDVPAAEHGVGVESPEAVVVTVSKPLDDSAEPEIVLADGSLATLADVTAEVERGVAAGKEDVILKADRDVRHGFVVKVMRAVGEVEGAHLHVQVKDKKR
jgi:biopolymer transport protein ExbD